MTFKNFIMESAPYRKGVCDFRVWAELIPLFSEKTLFTVHKCKNGWSIIISNDVFLGILTDVCVISIFSLWLATQSFFWLYLVLVTNYVLSIAPFWIVFWFRNRVRITTSATLNAMSVVKFTTSAISAPARWRSWVTQCCR